jgi:hypothetical protein
MNAGGKRHSMSCARVGNLIQRPARAKRGQVGLSTEWEREPKERPSELIAGTLSAKDGVQVEGEKKTLHPL